MYHYPKNGQNKYRYCKVINDKLVKIRVYVGKRYRHEDTLQSKLSFELIKRRRDNLTRRFKA